MKPSEIWKEIKPRIGEMLMAVNDIETRAEKVQEEAYQRGLSDAWEAARKIVLPGDVSGIYLADLEEIFDRSSLQGVIKDYSASECIDKIRQYEQEKEEIKVGDEVEDGVANLIVLEINQDGTVSGFDDAGSIIHATPRKKTGRHFPEIAEALQKMKKS